MLLVSCVCMITLVSAQSCKRKTNWNPTYKYSDTNPYGTYITYDLLKEVFHEDNISISRKSITRTLKPILDDYILYYDLEEGEEPEQIDMSYYDSISNVEDVMTYMSISNIFQFKKNDNLTFLLDFAAVGNNVFIAAQTFDYRLLDTLQLDYIYHIQDTAFVLSDYDTTKIYNYTYPRQEIPKVLSVDSCKLPFRILGTNEKLRQATFIKIQYGKGNIYLHTLPVAFTNINVLDEDKYKFVFKCLSYIPKESKIIWDEYTKKHHQGLWDEDEESSGNGLLKVMLSSPPLRVALLLIILGIILYMIFTSKRRQRIIPDFKPFTNSSVEFMNTISNLFYKKKDYKAITERRHAYFLEFIRHNYYIQTERIDSEFIDLLHAKSGMDVVRINKIFELYNDITLYLHISENQFMQYNRLLEEFYDKVKNKSK